MAARIGNFNVNLFFTEAEMSLYAAFYNVLIQALTNKFSLEDNRSQDNVSITCKKIETLWTDSSVVISLLVCFERTPIRALIKTNK
jgi:hypothetical protein